MGVDREHLQQSYDQNAATRDVRPLPAWRVAARDDWISTLRRAGARSRARPHPPTPTRSWSILTATRRPRPSRRTLSPPASDPPLSQATPTMATRTSLGITSGPRHLKEATHATPSHHRMDHRHPHRRHPAVQACPTDHRRGDRPPVLPRLSPVLLTPGRRWACGPTAAVQRRRPWRPGGVGARVDVVPERNPSPRPLSRAQHTDRPPAA